MMLTSLVPLNIHRSTCNVRSVGMLARTVLVTSLTCSVKSPYGVIMIPTVDPCFSWPRFGPPCSCTGIRRVWLCCDHDVRNVHYSLGGNCQKSDRCPSLLQAESTVELWYKLRWRDYKVNFNSAAKSRTFHCGKALNWDQENGQRFHSAFSYFFQKLCLILKISISGPIKLKFSGKTRNAILLAPIYFWSVYF